MRQRIKTAIASFSKVFVDVLVRTVANHLATAIINFIKSLL